MIRAHRFYSAVLSIALVASLSQVAFAQPRPGGGTGGAPGGGKATQSGPVQNKSVGPLNGQPTGDDDDQNAGPIRNEPQMQLPTDPLAVPPEVTKKIGSDDPGHYVLPTGSSDRSFYGVYYSESRGDYRLRLAPPFYIDHTRGIGTTTTMPNGAVVSGQDEESLYGGIYYRRRSPNYEADVLFPLAWRLRDHESRVYAFGPLIHRDAPAEHDNWAAPLVFEGERADGGYFHAPLLLTSSHWNKDGAFTIIGPYFRNRTAGDVDWGVAPFIFRGENTSEDSASKTYTLIPPLFYYHRDREADDNHITVIGPVLSEQTQKRNTFDVLPFYYSYTGKPESGGVREQATTLFPFFHSQESDEKQTFIVPGYYHRTTTKPGAGKSETKLTPFYNHITTRDGATDLQTAGPLFPMYWKYRDTDLAYNSFGLLPFYWAGSGPANSGFFTPLYAKFETYGVSRTYWAFPNITVQKDTTGWETDLHPIIYLGRGTESSHTVIAPVFWDFDNKKSRTTIGVPAFFRYADYTDNSIVQVAGNTLYLEKRAVGGKDWQFHFLPVFSYGENPTGYFWNVLFGLAGYTRDGEVNTVRAFWIPIQTSGPPDRKDASR